MARWLVSMGLLLVAAGLLWPWLRRIPLGRLPGDLVFGSGGFRVYIPLTSGLLVSLVVTLILYLLRR